MSEWIKNTLSLRPVRLQFVGTGNPVGNDPCEKAERILSQNILYLCREKGKTAGDLSEALGVPMPYIEEELEIQCNGINGNYSLLRELDHGKYISNILIVDAAEYEEANYAYEKYLGEFCSCLKETIQNNREKMLAFPFLSEQKDPGFIFWSLISDSVWQLQKQVWTILSEKYFSHIPQASVILQQWP